MLAGQVECEEFPREGDTGAGLWQMRRWKMPRGNGMQSHPGFSKKEAGTGPRRPGATGPHP